MIEILLQTLPFFGLIALGWGAGVTGFFSEEATGYITKFVFYFALSAMIFRFAANLSFADVFNLTSIAAYLGATLVVYLLVTVVALMRGCSVPEAAVEAQCGSIGNIGFLGIPMLALLMGEAAVGTIMIMLAVDLIVFGSLLVVLITGSGRGGVSPAMLKPVVMGLLKNPMVVSMALGLLCSGWAVPIPDPVNQFLAILGAAATPCALFAIGASLASKSAERVSVAGWLSFAKLVLHPAMVAVAVYFVFDVDPYVASVLVAASALPVAGNIYIVARHYQVAPSRVSAAILFSTLCSILTVSWVIARVQV